MRTAHLFLTLVLLQACHSIEEFAFRLYDVFPPARFVSGLVSADRARGFLIINAILVLLGLAFYFGPVRCRWPSWRMFVWPWVVIELVNGIGHPAWSVLQRGYTPGVVTAIPLLVVAVLLAYQLAAGNDFQASAT